MHPQESTSHTAMESPSKASVLFRPIASIKKKDVIGLEGYFQESAADKAVPARVFRDNGGIAGAPLEADRQVRRRILEAYVPFARDNSNLLLFLGFDASLVDQGVVGSGHLLTTVQELGLNPHNIVINIWDAEVRDTDALIRFVSHHREKGFLISLARVGAGHSNLLRVAQTRPDILKIDPDLMKGLQGEYYRTEIVKAVLDLTRLLGAMTVVEGVADSEEALAALEMGADMIEGEVLSFMRSPSERQALKSAVSDLAESFIRRSVSNSKTAQSAVSAHEKTFSAILRALQDASEPVFSEFLVRLAQEHPAVECLYVLDQKGVQITDTVSLAGRLPLQKKLFQPAEKGADHSTKEYFYLLEESFVGTYITEPYISLASGRLCQTLSGLFQSIDGKRYILCVDFEAK